MVSEEFYQECLKSLYGMRRFGIMLGLSTIREILKGLGNPQERYACIHIAGTNGKGSIASALATILHESGYRVGLYTSPHLVRFNERICIDNRQVSDDEVFAAYEAVKRVHRGDREPTFFEFTTAMALYLFGAREVDWAVIETGMGGRLDATNIIRPELSVITNISLEHQMYLGKTLAKIAEEKAGIIKPFTPVVTGVRQEACIRLLSEMARKNSAPMFRLGDQFRTRTARNGSFTYYGMNQVWPGMRTGLLGGHQIRNAALTLAACEILSTEKKADLSVSVIQNGLLRNRWPGRLEEVCASPRVILDGAHNLNAAQTLAEYFRKHFSGSRITFVIGILDDKPYQAMLRCLLPLSGRCILTRARIDRALPPEKLHEAAKDLVSDIRIIPEVGEALRYAVRTAIPDETICVAGSLYVVGEAKAEIDADGLFEKPVNFASSRLFQA